MKRIMLLSLCFILSGCATDNANNDNLLPVASGNNNAGQAAAQNIAPITQYVNSVR